MQADAEALDPATAAAGTRLIALGYGSVIAPLVAAALPRDAPVVLPWVAVGSILIAIAGSIALHQVLCLLNGHLRPHRRATVMVENLILLSGAAAVGYGLSGELGTYRLLLAGPVVMMAVMGSRRMLLGSWAVSVLLVAVTTGGSIYDQTALPGFVVAYGSGLLCIALFVRRTARVAFRARQDTELFVRITEVVASATDQFSALDDLLPVLRSYLRAERAAVLAVRNRLIDEHPLAVWPVASGPLDCDHHNDLRIAAVDGRTIIREAWTCVPVIGTSGTAELVLFVERLEPTLLLRPPYEHDVQLVRGQLEMLLTRLGLIAGLEGLTRTDSLTELPNRRALTERLERELAVARRTDRPLSLAMIDLDFFKRYNDTFGHVAGDELLKSVAALLRDRLRDTDFVARYGGEEFCAVLPATDAEDAAVVFRDIHRRGRELDLDHPLTFSAGIAEWDGDEAIADLVDRADQALYAAKSSGRAQTRVARNRPVAERAR